MFHHGHVTDQIKMGFSRKYSGKKFSGKKFSDGKGGFWQPFPPEKKIISGNFPPETETEFPLDALVRTHNSKTVKNNCSDKDYFRDCCACIWDQRNINENGTHKRGYMYRGVCPYLKISKGRIKRILNDS